MRKFGSRVGMFQYLHDDPLCVHGTLSKGAEFSGRIISADVLWGDQRPTLTLTGTVTNPRMSQHHLRRKPRLKVMVRYANLTPLYSLEIDTCEYLDF